MTGALCGLFGQLPPSARLSLTLDNGKEFARHEEIASVAGIDVFFARPYHSWERGTNENTNGLIRRLHPKQSSFAEIGEEELKWIEMFLNDRPRKCLGWMTPRDTVLPLPLWGTPAGTGSTVSLGGTASRHSGFACFFTISTPFSHLAPTRRQRPHLLAAGVAIATGYREPIVDEIVRG